MKPIPAPHLKPGLCRLFGNECAMDRVQRCLRETVWPEWPETPSMGLSEEGLPAYLPTDALLQRLALASQRLVENPRGVWAHRVHLAVRSAGGSEQVRRLGVPL